MKKILHKLKLILFPWSYSDDGETRTHRRTGKKQIAVIEDDWLGMPSIYFWKDAD